MSNRDGLLLIGVLVVSAAIGSALAVLAANGELEARPDWIVAAVSLVATGMAYRAIPRDKRWRLGARPTLGELLLAGLMLMSALVFAITLLTILHGRH